MKRLVLALALVVVWVVPAQALSQNPTVPWPQMVGTKGRVRTIEIVNGRIYVGGLFDQFRDVDGTVSEADNLAVMDMNGQFVNGFPNLTGGGQVWDLVPYGDGVIAGGRFSGPTSQLKNLVYLSPSGEQWFTGATTGVKAVETDGSNVWAAGKTVAMWSAPNARVYSGRTPLAIDPTLRGHLNAPSYRDLLLLGGNLYAACQCDGVGDLQHPAKAIIRLNPSDGSWEPAFEVTALRPESEATGISLATANGDLFLGAGGSDFLARVRPDGSYAWRRDTSGSAQHVEIASGELLAGGHFVEVGDVQADDCGKRSSDPGTLDPRDECLTRWGLANYSLDGAISGWNPALAGKYNLAWDIEMDGAAIHVVGEFKTVDGVARNFYTKLV